MSKARRVFWLVSEVTPYIRGRALLMSPHGFEVKFFTSVEAIKLEVRVVRAGIVFVSDDGTEFDINIKVKTLADMPEFRGARLVLVTQNRHSSVFEVAAASNFRDLIPINLPDDVWIQRVVYSCGVHPQPFIQPAGQITLNNISALALPARIIWMSDSRIRLECRLRPPVGAKLKLTGKLAEELGVKQISIVVESSERTRLVHRFSDAIIGKWKIPTENQKRYQDLIWRMRLADPGHAYRAFVAAKDSKLRSQLLTKLGRPDFIVSSALQIQSIVTEPKFFTPEIVFIEDVLTSGPHEARFAEMLGTLSVQTPVIVIGLTQEFSELKKRFPNNRLMVLKRMPVNFEETVLEKVLPSIKQEASGLDLGSTRIPQSDELSYGNLSIPARLLNVHPRALKIAVPFDIGCYGLAQLSSPLVKKLLGRDVWIKITESYRTHRDGSAPFIYQSEGIFVDSDAGDQERMGNKLAELVRDNFTEIFQHKKLEFLDFTSANRTPELGSLRHLSPPQVAPPSQNQQVRQQSKIYAVQAAAAINYQEVDLSAEDIRPLSSVNIQPESELTFVDISAQSQLGEFSEKAMDIAQNVYENVTSQNFKRTVMFIALSAFTLAIVLALLYGVAENYNHSGGVYTDTLYRYAPRLKKLVPQE
jgi:hypothetical protein